MTTNLTTPALAASMPSRAEMSERLQQVGEIAVLIVGGGINGVGTFRELALQGVRCLIVGREDFGAGASSASSRMAHGGLRYLENGEFRLVAEATHERNRLLRNAARGVVPLPITVPFFSIGAGVLPIIAKALHVKTTLTARGLMLVALGLRLYDWLGRHNKLLPNHSIGLRGAALQRFPLLHPGVRGFANYYDAKILYPERIAVELVGDAIAAQPDGLALNHCALEGREGASVLLRDRIDGRLYRAKPKVVVNAGGAWIDSVNRRIAESPALIGGTKGSHLVIDNPALSAALGGSGFLWDDGAGRMCVVYPHLDKVILGSTDIRIEDADQAVCERSEQDYLPGAISVIFPMVAVEASQVCYRFCGVRPLPRSSSKTTVDISRDHSNVRLAPQGDRPFPVHSLVGGKWTTFRAFASQVADSVLAELKLPRRTGTEETAIGGGLGFPLGDEARARWVQQAADELALDAARIETVLGRYGTRARIVASYCLQQPDRPLRAAADYSEREIAYLIEHEMAVELEDLVYRRSTLALMGRVTEPLLRELATLLARRLGWSPAEISERVQRARSRLSEQNGVRFGRPSLAPLDAFEPLGAH